VGRADDSHRLTGWNAVKSRVEQLNLEMSDEQVKDATAKIKELADVRTQSMEDVDKILRIYHTAIQSGSLKVGQSEVLDQLLEKVGLLLLFVPPSIPPPAPRLPFHHIAKQVSADKQHMPTKEVNGSAAKRPRTEAA
jgi:hypothetical protein